MFVLLSIIFCLFKCCNHLEEEEKAGCFAIIVLQVYCYYKCSLALPHGAVGWSAVCDCVFPDHTHFVFKEYHLLNHVGHRQRQTSDTNPLVKVLGLCRH